VNIFKSNGLPARADFVRPCSEGEKMIKPAFGIALASVVAGALVYAASKPVTVQLNDAKGMSVGTAVISENKGGNGVTIKLNVKNLTPGPHALHFHMTAKCEGPAFTSAGGHFNPETKHHGLENPEGPHAGDMPNFTVTAKGTAKAIVLDPRVNLGSGANSLYANGGTALMIHAKADDMKSDPAGNAGDRIACGTITKP
jgi:Cu-Zn family superoxide dismutase